MPSITVEINITKDELVIEDDEFHAFPLVAGGVNIPECFYTDDAMDVINYAFKRIRHYQYITGPFAKEDGDVVRYLRHSDDVVFAYFAKVMHGFDLKYGIHLSPEQIAEVPVDKIELSQSYLFFLDDE